MKKKFILLFHKTGRNVNGVEIVFRHDYILYDENFLRPAPRHRTVISSTARNLVIECNVETHSSASLTIQRLRFLATLEMTVFHNFNRKMTHDGFGATMKCLDAEKLDELPGLRLEENDTFSFRCHPEVSCFNLCCRNLNLFLYPYDALRLKQRLGISSDAFIDQYSDIVLRPSEFFPEVLLRMSENEAKTCPFLTDEGCSVYADRPDACRTFPVEQGLLYDSDTRKTERIHFFRPPDFCQGKHEKKTWTIKTWISDQEAEMHNSMTARWAEVRRLFQHDPWGGQGPYSQRGKMAFMAAYNTDRFREFVFESSFLKRYRVKSAMLKRAEKDDTELLKFGFEWIKLFLWGIRSEHLKPNR